MVVACANLKNIMSKHLKTVIYISLLIFLTSCLITKELNIEEVAGKYKLNLETYGVVKTIDLHSDKTFEYNWVEGLNYGSTSGSWHIEDGKVVLNSHCEHSINVKDNFKLIETSSYESDSILIHVLDVNNEAIPFSKCFTTLNSKKVSSAFTNIDGVAKLEKTKADSLIIRNVDFENAHIKHEPSISYYKVILKYTYTNFHSFISEKWKFKNNRLYDPSVSNNGIFKKVFYKKVD